MTATLPTRPRTTSLRDLARGLLAALALVVFVLGVPAALIALAPLYLPDDIPSPSQITSVLTGPDDGTLLLGALALIAWAAWAVFSASVLLELIAGARRTSAPRLPLLGGVQRTASQLVATAGILLALSSTTVARAAPAQAATAPPVTAQLRPAQSDAAAATPYNEPTTAPLPVLTQAEPALPVVTVQRGDTLWGIAERHLGSGPRYAEIRDLNTGRVQPDGRTLTSADWILPGWTLRLPADASGVPTEHPATAAAPRTPAEQQAITVAPGDTLWDVAATHLGDGARYGEIADLNRGRPQPDGRTLADADHLRPGWVLLLPPSAAPAPADPSLNLDAPTTAGADSETATPTAQDPGVPRTAAEQPQELLGPLRIAPAPPVEPSTQDAEAAPTIEDDQEVDELDAGAQRTWFAGLTALAAAGLIGELTRRRHRQQRARRLGERIPLPERGTPAARAESTLRSAPTPVSIEAIGTTLINLGCRCFDGGRELPRVGALLLDETTLTLLLVEDDPDAIAPFVARDSRTWVASTAEVAAETEIDDPDRCVPYPLLVTLGHTDGATVLVNLEACGTLAILGDDAAADEVLRALVLDAATSDLAGRLCVCVPPDDELTDLTAAFEPQRLRTVHSSDERETTTSAVSQALAAQGLDDTHQARGDRQAIDTWLPVTYVERTITGSACQPWTGTAVLTRQQATDSGAWTLTTDPHGAARLEPLGISVQPQRLDLNHLAALRDVLEVAVPPAPTSSPPPALAPLDEELQIVRDAHPAPPGPSSPDAQVIIRVLGPIDITGLPDGNGPLSPRMTELLVYLALHGPATGADLDEVLYNGARIKPGTRNALVYRTRRHVGEHALPLAGSDGLYRLGDAVTSDWDEFQRRLAEAVRADCGTPIERLTEALSYVRDRPFRGISGAEYTWADYDIQRMTEAIADAATLLARHQLAGGRARDALCSALRALAVNPYSEVLQHLALAAAESGHGADRAADLRDRFAHQGFELEADLPL
ncbi:MAG: LysM peptidoglycan-binding domain-containing protein [Cellulomonadaceae bacterium]|nr:LysM peptidoglycan-binding domain-containing protein [Cellulomonadaceae bacterium]